MKKLVQALVEFKEQYTEGLLTDEEYVRCCLDKVFIFYLNIKSAEQMGAAIEVLEKLDAIA